MKKRICAFFLAFCLLLTLFGDLRSLAAQAECPYCDYTLAEDGTVVHSDYCNAEYAYDGSGDVGKYVRLSDFSAENYIMVSGDPETDDGGFFYYEEFVEGTVMRINDWYWDPGTAALWYQVEIYVGGIVEEAQEYWPETPWVLQNYTENWVEEENALTFVSVCDICGGVECRQTHLYCLACEKFGCELTHQFCGYCNDYDCGIDHLGQNRPAEAPVIPEDPTLTEGADVSVADEYGNAVTDSFILSAGMKSSLSAWTDLEGELSYQWQICVEDQWIDILGQKEQGILVSPAMFLSVAEDGRAVIRCEVTNGEEVLTSAEITVSVADALEMAAFARGSSVSAQADGDGATDLQKVSLIVEYKFTNNTVAANPWTAELSVGKEISEKIKLPVIPGYLPTFVTTGEVELVEEDGTYYLLVNYADGLSEDTLLTVTYQPTNVKVTVLHYWQNVDNDNYVLHETTTKQLLTGSAVGDVHETYPGFYNLLYEKPVVAADGSTIVSVYYDRYYYLMKFDLSGGFGVDPLYIRYGASVGFIPTPTRPGYDFNRWQLNGVDAEIPATMPAENQTYKAVWSNPRTVNYTVVYWRENADDTNYSIWGSVTKQAVAGTTVSGADDVPAIISNATVDGEEVNEKQFFTYNDALTDKNVVVEGDGSTTVHVYYTRNYYTLYFKGVSGTCVLEEHTHGDGTCEKPLLCHVHDSTCERELICTTQEHTHGSDCCPLEEHVHTEDCYTCEEHVVHSTSCYSNVGDRYRFNTSGWPAAEGRIYASWGSKYIYINETWYSYTGSASNGTTVTPECSGIHTHGDGDCTYKDTEHTHGEGDCPCSVTEHIHDSACYEWQCLQGHEHTDACYGACIKYTHTHNNNCTNNSTSNVIYVIHAKYNAYIGDVWPTAAIISGLAYWTGTGVDNQSSKIMNMVSAICVAGGNTFTYHSNNTAYQLNYMFESFDQTSAANGTTRISWNGKYYDLSTEYSQIAYYRSNQSTWGYKKISGMSAASSTNAQNNNNTFTLYYNRNRNTIYFENTHTGDEEPSIKSVTDVMYGQPLANYSDDGVLLSATEAPYPSGLPEHAYRFDGWYTTPEGYEGTKFDFATATMPDGDLYLYAKWVPVTRTIRFFLDKKDFEANTTIPEKLPREPYITDFVTRTVPNGSYLLSVDDPGVADGDEEYHPYSQYRFEGWYYMDEGVEKRFVTGGDGLMVLQDLDLYAKWSSNVLKAYTVYFALDAKNNETGADGADGIADTDASGNIIYVADPITGSTLAGTSRTFDAKGDTALYPAYRNGYYPDAVSHTINVSIDDPDNEGENTHTFLYTPHAPVSYTVKYRIEGTDQQVPGTTDKTVADNTKAVVTENFVPVSGYMPDAYQKTLVIRPGGDNTLIFWYTKDEQHALYQINHYIQNLDGTTWTEYDSNTFTGDIGADYSADPYNNIDGFVFSATETDKYNVTEEKNGYTGEELPGAVGAYADGKVTGTLTSNGMQLNLYYTRNEYPYQIYFLEYGSNRELKNTINEYAAYGALVSHTAESVFTKTDEGIEFELYDTEPETKTMTIMVDKLTGGTVTYNKIVFYYKRCTQDLTISKVVTGEGANPDQAFSFTVTIDPKYSFHQDSYAYGEGKYLSPVDGVLSFSLKNGESITLQDLPTAEYTITEVNLPLGYYADFDADTVGEQASKDIVLTKDDNVTVACTNTYDPAVLEITKTVDVVEDNDNIPEVEEFKFTVTVPDGVTGSYDYTVEGVKHTETVADGKLTLTLKNGQTARFENVPVGSYTVEGEDYSARGYKSSFVVNGEQKGEGHSVVVQVARGETQTVQCINHFPVGHLQIKKTVTKEFFGTAWDDDTFTFTVERTTEGRPLINGNQYDVYEGESKVDTATVTDGKLQVEIKFTAEDAAKLDEQSEQGAPAVRTITIRNLPAGTYEVTESADADYVQTPASRVVYGLEIPAEETKASFINELIRPKGDLSLSKELVAADGYTGELPQDTEFSFTFEATLLPPPNGKYEVKYKDKNGNDVPSMLTTVEMKDGKFTLKIQDGQTVTIKNLPIDTYRITEATVPRMANAFYHNGSADPAEIDKDSAGNLCTQIPVPAGRTAAVRCVNTYPVDNADLTIIHENAEPGQIFVYEVKNTTNEIITVTVTAGNDGYGSTTIVDLPFGSYTVTQKNDWSWRYREEASDDVKTVVHSSGDTTVEFAQTWIDYWLGGCSALLKNIFRGG